MKTGILDGGLTGLILASLLPETHVLEKEAVPGGLCRSFVKNGFGYDIGGHVLFSKDKTALGFLLDTLGDNCSRHYRRNEILCRERFVRYPFENGLPDLAFGDRWRCFWGYCTRPRIQPSNFGEWIVARFGHAIADMYLTPYNEKIWKTKLSDISTGWVERVPSPPLRDLIKGALGLRTEGYLHQLYFHYPKQGNIASLIAALAQKATRVQCNFTVRRVEHAHNQWTVSDGDRTETFDRLISTIPAPDLIHALAEAPDEVLAAAAGLRANALITVLVGVNNATPPPRFGIYVPQKDVIFHRVCFPTYLDTAAAPEGKGSLVAEITVSPDDALLECTDEEIVARVSAGLAKTGIAHPSEIITTEVRRHPHAYVIDTHDRRHRMEVIGNYCARQNIHICGRFAEFEYLNMDACTAHALSLAETLR